ERAGRLQNAVAHLDEVRTNLGYFVDNALGRNGSGLELSGGLGERRRERSEPLAERRQALGQVFGVRSHGGISILSRWSGGVSKSGRAPRKHGAGPVLGSSAMVDSGAWRTHSRASSLPI